MLETEALQGKAACYKSVYAKKDRNGPSSANQGLSTSEPRHGHTVCTGKCQPGVAENGASTLEMEALRGKAALFLSPFMLKRTENYGPSSANQGLSTNEPRHGLAVCTLCVHPSDANSMARLSKGHCQM